jgi:hypothetical protein
MQLWSQAFLDGEPVDAGVAVTDERTWHRLMEENEGAARLIARIDWASRTWYVALGSPTRTQEAGGLYLPLWMLDQLGIEGIGEEAEVIWLGEDAFPEATKIVLRPHDSAFYHADAKEELERALTRMGVIQLGTTLEIPLDVLGGYPIGFDVVGLEPAGVVLAQGDEVAIEFEEAIDASGATVPVAAALAPPAQEESPADFSSMVSIAASAPAPAVAAAQGHVLGGHPPRRTADGKPWNPWREAKPKAAAT